MNIFYAPNIEGDYCLFDKVESNHFARVLRLKTGDNIEIVDGRGTLYHGVLVKVSNNESQAKIIERIPEFSKRTNYLHIAIAPTKNAERIEWFVEKATEIGIDEITPILCEHSERKVLKAERIEKVMISAMKQSGKAYLPRFNPMVKFGDILSVQAERKMIAHCYPYEKTSLSEAIAGSSSNLILIGPEGDFSEREVKEAVNKDFISVGLGTSRLRTETAAIVACHTVSLILK